MAKSRYDGISIREFLVDLLACLVPGFLFLFLTFEALAWPAWSLIRAIQGAPPVSAELMQKVKEYAEAFRFELVGFFLFGSYVVGHLLYRQDPKVPDRYSCERAIKEFTSDEKDNWVVRQQEPSKIDVPVSIHPVKRIYHAGLKRLRRGSQEELTLDIQFPYRYLREYLDSRNLSHLASLITWKGALIKSHHKRTKAFINILKIRLMFYCPDKCGQITRNEAHVRLMSSVWYAGRSLLIVSLIGVGVGIIAGLTAGIRGIWNAEKLEYLIPILACIPVSLISIWTMRTIEKFLHYQRVREIIFVLEMAYNAMQMKKEIMAGLREEVEAASNV